MSKWILIDYFDVWGNKKYGYVVNDQRIITDNLVIKDETPKGICNLLEQMKVLRTSDMRRLEVVDYGNTIEIIERKSGRPLFGLSLKETN